MAKNFEFLEQIEGVKFEAWGKSLEEVFSNCAKAVSKTLCKGTIGRKKVYTIKTYGKDNESLLYNFLKEILYLFEKEHFILGRVKEIKIKDNKLTAKVLGDDLDKYEIKTYIKSPSREDMLIKKEKDRLVAQVILEV